MDQHLHNLHLRAGAVAGEAKTCGTKTRYATEELAIKAALAHNRWAKRRHDVEAYPCAFCQRWHVGGIMPIEVLEAIVQSESASPSASTLLE